MVAVSAANCWGVSNGNGVGLNAQVANNCYAGSSSGTGLSVTIAIGCTGGFHRSIAIAEALAEDLRASGKSPVSVWHRELDRE